MLSIFKKGKIKPKFEELFIRVRHKKFGEGFIVAYGNGLNPIGVRFDNNSNDLGSLMKQYIVRGYESYGNSEWFDEDDLEEIEKFDYINLISNIKK